MEDSDDDPYYEGDPRQATDHRSNEYISKLGTSLRPDHDPNSYRTNCSELAEKYMNGWNRLFVVIAVCWAIVSPFLVAREANRVPELTFHNCADPLTKNTGQVTRLCLI